MRFAFAGNGPRQSSAVENAGECFGIWIRTSRPTGPVEAHVSKSCNPSLRKMRRTLLSRAIWTREIFLAYLCIFLIESACLFPAVWVRLGDGSRTRPLGIHRPPRSPADAPDESLARAALVSHLDDRCNAYGRRVDLV